jgi:hypothetical protein
MFSLGGIVPVINDLPLVQRDYQAAKINKIRGHHIRIYLKIKELKY